MAFVDITDPKSPLGCGTLMLPYTRVSAPLVITDEAGIEILSHTNAPVIIKRLLRLIEDTNRPEDFTKTLSAMSTRREQPQEICNRLKRLGYPIEFDYSERHAKEYILRSSNTKQTAYLVPDEVTFWYPEWATVDSLMLNPHGKTATIIGALYKTPNAESDGLPKNLDLTSGKRLTTLQLKGLDWTKHDVVFPQELETLELQDIKNFPKYWDISNLPNLKKLRLNNIDLHNFEFNTLPLTIETLELNSSTLLTNLNQLSLHPNLQNLRIGKGNDLNFCKLPRLPRLRTLDMPECKNINTDYSIARLYPNLYGIDLSGTQIKNAQFMELPKTLAFLYINNTKFPLKFDLQSLPLERLKSVKWKNKTTSGRKLEAELYAEKIMKGYASNYRTRT